MKLFVVCKLIPSNEYIYVFDSLDKAISFIDNCSPTFSDHIYIERLKSGEYRFKHYLIIPLNLNEEETSETICS